MNKNIDCYIKLPRPVMNCLVRIVLKYAGGSCAGSVECIYQTDILLYGDTNTLCCDDSLILCDVEGCAILSMRATKCLTDVFPVQLCTVLRSASKYARKVVCRGGVWLPF